MRVGVDWLRDLLLPLLVTVVGTTLAAGTTAVIGDAIKHRSAAAKTGKSAAGKTGGTSAAGKSASSKTATGKTSKRRPASRGRAALEALRRDWWKIVIAVASVTTAVALVILVLNLAGDRTQDAVKDPDSATTVGSELVLAGSGPDRDTVSALSRNSQVTLNSMIDNPVHGDERNFVQIKAQDAPDSEYTDHMVVEPGGVYTVFVYYSNDAAESETASVAENTRLRVQAPGVFTGSASVYATLTASNAEPEQVWDGATMVLGDGQNAVALRYLRDSAVIHSGGAVDGTKLPDQLFTDGVLLGCDALDGRLPSAARCSGYITFEVRVDQPDFVVTAEARVKGSDAPYLDHVETRVGQVIQVRVMYQNTGTTQQDNVSVRVMLPDGFRYIEESTVIANYGTSGEYKTTEDGVTTNGFDVGSFQPGGKVYLRFDVMVDDEVADQGARLITVPEFLRVTTSGGAKYAPLTFVLLG